MSIHLTKEQRLAVFRELVESGDTASKVADRLGIRRNTVYDLRKELLKAGLKSVGDDKQEDLTPVERHDAEFWRRKYRAAVKAGAELEHVVKQLSGVVEQVPSPPAWTIASKESGRSPVAPCLMTSDHHVGEKIVRDELDGVNAYDIDTYRSRYRRLISAAINVSHRLIDDNPCPGFVYFRLGDTISGDIHDELKITNELTSHEQVLTAVEEEVAGIRKLADAFGQVWAISVSGNHGRTTKKPMAKLYSATNYDMLIAHMIARELANDDRVSFFTPPSGDAHVPLLGWNILATHGDRIGSRGGQGFIGPSATIARGLKKLRDQQSQLGRPVDLVINGHFHTSLCLPGGMSNGSLSGYSEYAHSLRAEPEPPQQWLFAVHQKWGVRERVELKVEEPAKIDRPRVRVPAGMAR